MKHYTQCGIRFENRGDSPPTTGYVDRLIRALDESGIEACWHSALGGLGRPLYPTRLMTNVHPEAAYQPFRYLLERLHATGRPVVSWMPLTDNEAVREEHPGWALQPLTGERDAAGPEGHWARNNHGLCPNSPYGQLLPRLAAEIVGDVGFDGVWFDHTSMAMHYRRPVNVGACGCDFCRARFKADTGLALPPVADLGDPVFRRWLVWRYDVLMELLTACVDAVHAVRPDALIGFNMRRRRRHLGVEDWASAIPMQRLGLNLLMSGEVEGFPTQGDFQIKLHRAMACRQGAETWWPLCDHWHMFPPDVESLNGVQAALAAVAAGGGLSTGAAVAARDVAYALKAMQGAIAPLLPFVEGEPLAYAAIWCSQQTQDFGFRTNSEAAYDRMHGANELCLHAHVQSAVVFDDHLDEGGEALAHYPVLLAPTAECISRRQADALRAYVETGGVLVACENAGTSDEWGEPHSRPILDDLLGIQSRRPSKGQFTLLFERDGPLETCGVGLSYFGDFVIAEPALDCTVLALAADRTAIHWDGADYDYPTFERHPGLWQRKLGKGWVLYCVKDLFANHLCDPTTRAVRLFQATVCTLAPPPVAAEAPLCVTLNARRLADGRLAVILHNAPGSAYRYPAPSGRNYLHAPGEVMPISDVTVVLAEGIRCTQAILAETGTPLDITDNGRRVRIPRLELAAVALLSIEEEAFSHA